MRPLLVPLALVLVLAPRPGSAAALPAQPQLGFIDDDVPVVVSLTPATEVALLAWARRTPGERVGAELRAWALATATGYQRRLGFDATSSWEASGLAPDAPVVAGLFAVDPAATELAFHALADKPGDAKAAAKAPRAWSRSRLVAFVQDEKKVRAMLATLAGSGADVVLTSGPAAGLAAVFGADAKLGKGIAGALARAKVVAVARGRTPWGGDWYVFVRIVEHRFLVVDALEPFALPVEWKRDGAAMLKLVARNLGKRNLGLRVTPTDPVWMPFASARAAAYVQPERLLDAGKFAGWSRVLAATTGIADPATARSVLDTGEREVAACEDFRPIAAEAPLAELLVTASPTAAGFDVDVAWTLRTPGALDAAFATRDDGLVDLAAASGTRLLALVPLAGTDGLRQLPRPGVLGQERRAIDERTRLCGAAGALELALFAWPQLGALAADADPQVSQVFRALGNVAFAVKRFGTGVGESQMVVVGSFAQPLLHEVFDRFLKRTSASAGKRKLTVWKSGRGGDPWAVASGDAARTTYGLAWGGDAALSWWWGQPSPASAGGALPFVALVRTDLPWLFASVLEPQLATPGFGELGQNLGALKAQLTLSPAQLGLHVSVETK